MTFQVKVKWGKSILEITLEEVTIAALKTKVFELSNVPEARQKLMCKGKILDTDEKLQTLPPGSIIMMIGSAQVVQVVEVDKTTQSSTSNETIPIPNGLTNLGNTCWLNASLKVLYNITELKQALIQYYENTEKKIPNPTGNHTPTPGEIAFTVQLGKLMKHLDTSEDDTLIPGELLRAIATCYPDLVQVDARAIPMQQDADEFFTLCLNSLDRTLNGFPSQLFSMQVESTLGLDPSELNAIKEGAAAGPGSGENDAKDDDNDATTTTSSLTKEEPTITYETLHKLRCTVNQDTIDIRTGLGQAMTEQIEKRSPTLERSAQYNRVNKLVTLPKYLIVHLQRFQWKADTKNKAKIIRKVTLNMNLDLYGLATESTQKLMDPFRKTIQKITEETQRLSAPSSTTELTPNTSTTTTTTTTTTNDEKMDDGETSLIDFKGVSGYYDIHGIVTHQGRDAESGHYVGWTKLPQSGNSDKEAKSTSRSNNNARDRYPSYTWVKHDDDKISLVEDKDIINLSGGGDWHTAYICIYKLKENDA